MIGKLIIALLNIISKIVSILLLPLDSLVNVLLPNSILESLFQIRQYLLLPTQYMGWIFNLLNVPSIALSLIVSYWVFKYAVIGATVGVKRVITIYQRFKM